MKDIERIIKDICVTDGETTEILAKAIEQYVIKARIEELKLIYKDCGLMECQIIDERIAELKKGLK